MSSLPSSAGVPPLRYAEFQKRLSSQVYVLYTNYSFLIKSGVFTVAALSLFHIVAASPEFEIGRLLFWLVSFAFCLVTISTWSRGCVMTNAKARIFDVILPLGIAIPEYLLFIVLDPTAVSSKAWNSWYLMLAIHAAFGLAITSYRLRLTDIQMDFDEELQPLARDYLQWIKLDRLGAACGVLLNLTIYLITVAFAWFTSPSAYFVHYGSAILLLCIGLFISHQAFTQYDQMTKYKPPLGSAAV